MNRAGELATNVSVQILTVVGLIAFWWWASANATGVNALVFPTPDAVWAAVWNDWILDFGTSWTNNYWPSIRRLLLGFVLASALSVLIGVAIGRSRRISELVEPVIHFVRAIPPPALLPLFIVLFGLNDTEKVVLIATGVFPPILLNTIDGVRTVEPDLLDTAKAYQIGARRRLTHVVLPAASPRIFAGLRIAMSIAVILMVISELFAATDGIGYRIQDARTRFAYTDLWAGLIVLGALGLILNAVLVLIERWALRWSRQ